MINIPHIQVLIKIQCREKDLLINIVPNSYIPITTKSINNSEVLMLSIYIILL